MYRHLRRLANRSVTTTSASMPTHAGCEARQSVRAARQPPPRMQSRSDTNVKISFYPTRSVRPWHGEAKIFLLQPWRGAERRQPRRKNRVGSRLKYKWLRHLDSTRSAVRSTKRRRAVRHREAKRSVRAARQPPPRMQSRSDANVKISFFPNAKRAAMARRSKKIFASAVTGRKAASAAGEKAWSKVV